MAANGDITVPSGATLTGFGTIIGPTIINGNFGHKQVTKTIDYTAANETAILCDATGGTITVTLPAAASSTDRIYHIKKIDSSTNMVTVDGNASETIDGATTQIISYQYNSLEIVCDGSNWFII